MSPRSRSALAVGALLCSALAACQPKIGDDCKVSSECGAGTVTRVCDTTLPGGYCTIYNCEPGSCPSEAICVAFHRTPSAAPPCAQSQASTRLARSFCLRRCQNDSDCRGGYTCLDLHLAQNPQNAAVLESAGTDGHACVPPYSGPPLSPDTNPGVCEGNLVSEPDLGVSATGGAAGAAGAAGAGIVAGGAAGSVGRLGAGGQSGVAGESTGGAESGGQAGSGGEATGGAESGGQAGSGGESASGAGGEPASEGAQGGSIPVTP
jgi:hypothetical protein